MASGAPHAQPLSLGTSVPVPGGGGSGKVLGSVC